MSREWSEQNGKAGVAGIYTRTLPGVFKKDKGLIMEKFIAVTGHHRKHGIRLLGQSTDGGSQAYGVKGLRIYNEAVHDAVILV